MTDTNQVPPAAGPRPEPDLEAVRQFWNANPLYAGESPYRPGERAFYEHHEREALFEYSGALPAIFVRDVGPGREVLDVGCGIGFWVDQFARWGATVSACDLTETAVELTRRRAELFGFPAAVGLGNAEALPYPDRRFDHVNCLGVIHHTPNTAQCIEEFARVLRPDGTLCVAVYYRPWQLRSRLLFRLVTGVMRPWVRLKGRGRETMLRASTPDELVRQYDGDGNPIGKSYTRAQLRALLSPWFEVLEDQRYYFPRRVLPFRIPQPLHPWLARTMGLMIVVRCRKRGGGV